MRGFVATDCFRTFFWRENLDAKVIKSPKSEWITLPQTYIPVFDTD
jgi:hypothetical protein